MALPYVEVLCSFSKLALLKILLKDSTPFQGPCAHYTPYLLVFLLPGPERHCSRPRSLAKAEGDGKSGGKVLLGAECAVQERS